ncbi:HNH endonuclease [Streptomyces sp. SP17KL33]|uniref:HNH endonuclease n=1 Tax=Streptomyces sp. SP17KL33 TaxID=3002534 RepID=UPI003FCDBBB4
MAEAQSAKRCTKCGEVKALKEFYKRKNRAGGLESRCKECTRADSAKWTAANRERRAELSAKWNVANRERRAELSAKWSAENPDSVATKNARRRARKRNVPHEPYSRSDIFTRWGGSCAYCDAPAEHLDHVHPLSKGGADAPHNLVPACAPCNLSKGARTLAEWSATFQRKA